MTPLGEETSLSPSDELIALLDNELAVHNFEGLFLAFQ